MDLRVRVPDKTYGDLERLAGFLKTSVEALVNASLESMASYTGDLARWARELKVKKIHRVESLFDEVYYYAIEAWRNIVSRILDRLKARGRYELELLELNPDEPSIIVELTALEGSDLLADRLRIDWGLDGVLVEAYYYLEEGVEPPLERRGENYDWSYLPDQHAIVVTVRADSLGEIPPVYMLDRYSGLT